jgi:osmotically-inducible protein OsmY
VPDEDARPDQSSRPSPGEGQEPRAEAPGEPGGIEERIRARIEEDPRTRDLPSLSIEVDEGMAQIDGNAQSSEAKEALTELVRDVEGVNIVVNRVTVGSP